MLPWDFDRRAHRLKLWHRLAGILLVALAAAPLGLAAAQGEGPRFLRFVGRPPQVGMLNTPMGVAVSPGEDRFIFVVDAGNARVQVFRPSAPPVVGHWGRRGNGEGEFWHPSDVAVSPDGQFVYVVDSGLRMIKRFDIEALCYGSPVCVPRALQWGGRGRGPGSFQEPTGLAVDRRGNVYVVDRAASEVQVFDRGGSYLQTIAGPGNDRGSLLQPTDLDIGPDDRLWVADTLNDRIAWFTAEGKPDGVFAGPVGQGFFNPTGVAVAPDGSFVVRDFDPSFSQPRLWRFGPGRQLLDQRVLDGTDFGSPKRFQGAAFLPEGSLVFANPVGPDYNLYLWPAGKASPERMALRGQELTQFERPGDAAIDEQLVAVSDAGNRRVLVLSPELDFQPAMVLAPPVFDFDEPAGIAVHRPEPASPFNDAQIYIADPGRNAVFIATPRGQLLGLWGGGEGGKSPESLAGPEDVAVGAEGEIYIADTQNNRVVRRRATGEVVNLIGAGKLLYPSSVTVGPGGRVYVLERGANRLSAFSPEGELLGQWPDASGQRFVAPNGALGEQYVPPGEIWAPVSLAADDENLYLLENDSWRHVRVQVLRPQMGQPLTAEGVVVAGFADAQGVAPGQVSDPRGVAAAASGLTIVVDSGNNRLQLFDWGRAVEPSPTPSPEPTASPTEPPSPTPTDIPPTEIPPTETPPPTAVPTDLPVVPTATERRPEVRPVGGLVAYVPFALKR